MSVNRISDTINSFLSYGESAGDFSGHSVSSAGDVNGDGLDDLIVGTKEAKSYVVFGKQDTAAINAMADKLIAVLSCSQ
jgi:hypothetical protein